MRLLSLKETVWGKILLRQQYYLSKSAMRAELRIVSHLFFLLALAIAYYLAICIPIQIISMKLFNVESYRNSYLLCLFFYISGYLLYSIVEYWMMTCHLSKIPNFNDYRAENNSYLCTLIPRQYIYVRDVFEDFQPSKIRRILGVIYFIFISPFIVLLSTILIFSARRVVSRA